jgi:23S rRNA pseudouridine2457 synthase
MFKHTSNKSEFRNKKVESFKPDPIKTYLAFFKPYGILSQFSDEGESKGIGFLNLNLPKDVYPLGRLDGDSEGLLILTNDKRLNHWLLHPENKMSKTYWAQVEGTPTPEAIEKLQKGVSITVQGKTYQTLPSKARLLDPIDHLPERNPPIRFRKNVEDTWISITITEGKNRQVRKMTAAVGLPTLRLIRVKIGKYFLNFENIKPGEVKILSSEEVLKLLH